MMEEPNYVYRKGEGWVPSDKNTLMIVVTRDNVSLNLEEVADPSAHMGKPYLKILKSPNHRMSKYYTWWDESGNLNPENVAKHFTRFDWGQGRNWTKLDESEIPDFDDWRYFILVQND